MDATQDPCEIELDSLGPSNFAGWRIARFWHSPESPNAFMVRALRDEAASARRDLSFVTRCKFAREDDRADAIAEVRADCKAAAAALTRFLARALLAMRVMIARAGAVAALRRESLDTSIARSVDADSRHAIEVVADRLHGLILQALSVRVAQVGRAAS